MIKITATVTIDQEAKAEGAKPRVYFFHPGKDVGHNKPSRHYAPIQLYFDLLPSILRYGGMTAAATEVTRRPMTLDKWEPYAACYCGCAPAIALDCEGPYNLYVVIVAQSEVIEAGDTSAQA